MDLVSFFSSAISCRIAEARAMDVEANAPLRVSQASRDVPGNMIMHNTLSVTDETNPERMA
jgi:hypothetical protein